MMMEIIDPSAFGLALAAILLFGILGFLWLGRRLGQRTLARHGSGGTASIGSLETAVFALLGLIIAFTFSGALNRFDQRRAQAVDESNAVGTVWMRIGVLPDAAQPKLRQAVRDYVDARIATYRSLPDVKAAQQQVQKSQALQNEVWKIAMEALRQPGARPNADVLLLPALNQMFDLMSVRIVATQLHPPTVIYAMLVALALASALLAGYQSAGEKMHDGLHRFAFAAVITFTVYVILDIEYPRMGWIRLDAIDQVLVSVRAGMN
jgi:hypothetical protein